MSDDPIARLQLSDFEPLVGGSLPVDFGSGPIAASIVEARAVGGYTLRATPGFSVILKAAAPGVQQGIFKLSHPQLGELELFMTPRRVEAGLVVYEFVLN